MLAYELNVGFVPIRKKGKLPFTTVEETYELEYGSATVEIHTDAVQPGDRVVLIDDLIATGGTMMAGMRLLERLGATVIEGAAIVDLPELAGSARLRAAGLSVHTLVSFEGHRARAALQVKGGLLGEVGAHAHRHHVTRRAQQFELPAPGCAEPVLPGAGRAGPDLASRHGLDVGHARAVVEQARFAHHRPGRRMAMRLLPGGPPLTNTRSEPCASMYIERSASPCLMSRSPERISWRVRRGDHAPLVQREAGAGRRLPR